MTSPLPRPDWVPWWVHLAVLLAGGLLALLFLAMPFAVFGVKGRLEAIEIRLDEIQAEIRSLSLRLPEPASMDEPYLPAPADRFPTDRSTPDRSTPDRSTPDRSTVERPAIERYAAARPPVPPAPHSPPPNSPPARPGRTEPRLY